MNILITGATGFIGSQLLLKLSTRGHHVVGCVRDSATAQRRFPCTRFVECDFTKDHAEECWTSRLADIDIVINAVGIIREHGHQTFEALHHRAPAALFRAAARSGVRRVIQISALGADAGAQSRYHLTKRAADEVLSTLDVESIVLRPSIVLGSGAASSQLFRALAALPLIPLPSTGGQPLQPIHIDDLVAAVIRCVDSDTLPTRGPLELVGPAPVTFRQLLERLRQRLGLRPTPVMRIPYWLVVSAARAFGFLSRSPLSAETIAMLERGNTAPVAPLVEKLGVQPCTLDEALDRIPATDAERWYARLYFLRLPLRIAVAAVWLTAGVVSTGFFPVEESFALLAAVGVPDWAAPYALYGASALDFALGLALLLRVQLRTIVYAQIALIIGYSAILTLALPQFWLHPFGPLSKNLPLLVSTLILLALEERPWTT